MNATPKISKALKEVLTIVAEGLERGGLMSVKHNEDLSKELVSFLNETPDKAPELKKAREFKPEQFYLVLAKVDEVDEYNSCVHLAGSKASHWYHFDNIYVMPGEKHKLAATRKTIVKILQ